MARVHIAAPASPVKHPLNKPACGTPFILVRLSIGFFFSKLKNVQKIQLFPARFSLSASLHQMGALAKGPLLGLNRGKRNEAPLTLARVPPPLLGEQKSLEA